MRIEDFLVEALALSVVTVAGIAAVAVAVAVEEAPVASSADWHKYWKASLAPLSSEACSACWNSGQQHWG